MKLTIHQKQVFAGVSVMFFTLFIGFAAGVLVAHQSVDQRMSEAQVLLQKIDSKALKICESLNINYYQHQ